jgi:hypothetical protein
MDDLLWDTQAMEGILLHEIHQNKIGYDTDVVYTFFEILKSTSTTPLFSWHRSRSTQIVTQMLLYNLKAMYGMPYACFWTLLR